MSGDNKYLDLELSVIETRMGIMVAKSVEAEIDDDAALQAKCDAQIKLMSEAIKVKTAEAAGFAPDSSVSNATQKFIATQLNLIQEFKPPMEVSVFLQACDNAYQQAKLMPDGEQLLVQYLPLRMCQDYQTAWNAFRADKKVVTFAQFTDYMKTTYANGISTFQLLDSFDLLKKEPTESFPGYAVKITNRVSVLATEVIAKFEKAKGKPMTRDDVFKLIGGVAMIREVRNIPDAYTAVMTQVKDDFDATSIGQLAATFLTLKGKNDSVLGQTPTVNYAGRQPGNLPRSQKPCFKDGNCTRPWCPYLHTKQQRPKGKAKKGQNSRGGGEGQSSRGGGDGRQSEQKSRDQNNTRQNRNQGQARQGNVNMVEELGHEDELGDQTDIFYVESGQGFRQ